MAAQNLQSARDTLSCSLSYELFEDPVIETSGNCDHIFERAWIQEWLVDNNTCPLSRKSLELHQLVPHDLIREACALLDPDRVEPLNEEDTDLIETAVAAFNERVLPAQDADGEQPAAAVQHVLVAQEIHQTLMERILQKAKECKDVSQEGVDKCVQSVSDFLGC